MKYHYILTLDESLLLFIAQVFWADNHYKILSYGLTAVVGISWYNIGALINWLLASCADPFVIERAFTDDLCRWGRKSWCVPSVYTKQIRFKKSNFGKEFNDYGVI